MNTDFEFLFVEIKINILLILKRLGKNRSSALVFKTFYLANLGMIRLMYISGQLIFIDKLFTFKND